MEPRSRGLVGLESAPKTEPTTPCSFPSDCEPHREAGRTFRHFQNEPMPEEQSTQIKALGELAQILSEVEDGLSLPGDQQLAPLLESIHPSDLAELLSAAPDEARLRVFECIPDQEDAALVLSRLDEGVKEELLEQLPVPRVAELMRDLAHDEAADVLAELSDEDKNQVLAELDADEAADLRELAAYDPDSAGGLMTDEFVAVPVSYTVRAALMQLKTGDEDWEAVTDVFVVDDQNHLVGVVAIEDLLRARMPDPVRELMESKPVCAKVDEDSEEVAQRAAHYRLTLMPVVDENEELVGVITHDDVTEALGEEASEDMYRLAGTLDQHPSREGLVDRLLARFPFLLVTIVGTYLVAVVIELILGDIPEFDILRFVPMIAALAGNAGIQASTTMIRGFATGEVQADDFRETMGREVSLGLLTGAVAALVQLLLLVAFQESLELKIVVPVAQASSVVAASFFGTAIPFLCWRARWRIGSREIRIDPALAAGPFITTLNDVVSTVIALMLAVKIEDLFL